MKIIQVKTHKIELTTNDFCDDYTSMLGVYSDVLIVEDRSFCVWVKSAVDYSAGAVSNKPERACDLYRSAAVHSRAERVGASVGRTSHRTHPEHDVGGRLQVAHLDTHHHELRKRGSFSRFILAHHLTTLNVQTDGYELIYNFISPSNGSTTFKKTFKTANKQSSTLA